MRSLLEEAEMKMKLKRREAKEQERERKAVQRMVWAQGWQRDGYDANCDWVYGARPAEVMHKVRNMVVTKNSKTNGDVSKEENGEWFIK